MNLQDYLIGLESEIADTYVCPSCSRVGPAFIMAVTDMGTGGFVCSTCVMDAQREASSGLSSLSWPDVQAERNMRVNDVLWAVLPGSPLSPDCQSDFADYIAALHRVTVDFETPDAVVWPVKPELAYPTV